MTVTEYASEHPDPGFAIFMDRVDRVVASKADGFGFLDFADACWADLYDGAPGVTDEDIIETMADADDLFRAYLELEGSE